MLGVLSKRDKLTLTTSPLGSVSECSSPKLIVCSTVLLIPQILLKFKVPAEPLKIEKNKMFKKTAKNVKNIWYN